MLPHRIEVEHGLGRMLVLAVASIDDDSIGVLCDALRRAGKAGTADEHVDIHGGDRLDRVGKRLALHDRGRGATHREGVRRETLLCELEGALRARRRLEEQVHDRAATKCRDLLDRSGIVDGLECLGGIEYLGDIVSRQAVRIDEILYRQHQ